MKTRTLVVSVVVTALVCGPALSSSQISAAQDVPQQISKVYLPVVANNYPRSAYQWLSEQQVGVTGLMPNQQVHDGSTTYVNALAVMAFAFKGDPAKARRILDYFNSRAAEFFADDHCLSFGSACATVAPCGENHPCGFFQTRQPDTGVPLSGTNRWTGDNAWLLMAIHHYQAATGDPRYDPMARAIRRLLRSFQQLDGHIASGWENGDQFFNREGIPDGNLDAYKALSLYGEDQVAQRVKHWLDYTYFSDNGFSAWRKGALDLHSWRVLSLGEDYGFSLPDTERTDDATIRFRDTISFGGSPVAGFLPEPAAYYPPCRMPNIWSEGVGQMAVAFYKAGYRQQGDFYTTELEKLLIEPAGFPGTQALAYLPLADPVCYSWVDPGKGHVASVVWYLFARERFDPFGGVVINAHSPANPLARLQAENWDNCSLVGVRDDGRGEISEGKALHIGGDDATPGNQTGWVDYKFNVLEPATLRTVSVRYADDMGGDSARLLLDGNGIASFETIYTGGWDDYLTVSFPVASTRLQPGLHTLKVEFADGGAYGFTVDLVQID